MTVKKLKAGSTSIASAAVIVAAFSVVSRLAGFVRDRILIGQFGAGATLDVYYQAFRIPDLLLQLLVVGALSASFIPIFTRYLIAEDDEKAWRYTNGMLAFSACMFGALAVVGALFARPLAVLIAPGFSGNLLEQVAVIMRVMFIGQCFFSVSLVFGSVLQGAKRFVLTSLAPIVNNVGIIFGALLLVPIMGPIGLAWGTVLGAMMHAVVQLVGAVSLGYRPQAVAFWRLKDVRTSVMQMGPRVLGLAVNQINFVLMGVIATTLTAGSATIFNLAYTLNFFPIGVIAVSYAIAVFPTMCERVAQKDEDGFRLVFADTIRQVLLYIIPATVLFLLLRAQLVRILFGAATFDWNATILTADTLALFALSFFAQSFTFVLVRAYFAHEDTVTPLVVGVASALLNLAASWMLSREMGVAGLGLAFSLTAIFQTALLWVFLRLRVGNLGESKLLRSLVVLSSAGLVSGAATQAVKYLVVQWLELNTFAAVFAQTAIAASAGLLVYGLVALALGSVEMRDVLHGLKRKLLRAARPVEAHDNV